MGYEPQGTPPVTTYFPGAHLQIILPLTPFTDPDELSEPRSVLSVSLPDTFLTQPNQVRGHLVPLREELGFPDAGIGREDQAKFRKACEKLSRKLLKRSMPEPLVLDFSDLNWTPAQFETLLYLLQNVLQHRPTLLVEIDSQLAREVDELERQSAKTLLDVAHLSSSDGATGESFGEISERLFLETFSRVHAPVLGLDQNGRRFLFGVLEQEYKEPLLSLIDREASIEELCLETYRGTRLKESTLRSILNRVNCLFEVAPRISDRQLWRSVWDTQKLANEASRAMTRHFDEVVKRSNAWRGMEGDADGE
jgi:hypothetical protein